MTAYYNEIDPYAAKWLRNLIKAGTIAAGDVDERDIRDVTPAELMGYNQCHFFAGIGGWSRALRLAGWPDDRPVWTGSCPCQSFSAAGRGKGFADERHLWPYWFHIIRVCRPITIFGEQVASKSALEWLDLVSDDLAGEGYAVGAADLPAAGVGAFHIRQRLWFVAYCERSGQLREAQPQDDGEDSRSGGRCDLAYSGESPTEFVGHSSDARCEGDGLQSVHGGREGGEPDACATGPGATGDLADAHGGLRHGRKCQPQREAEGGIASDGAGEVDRLADALSPNHRSKVEAAYPGEPETDGPADRVSGHSGPPHFWSTAVWLPCRDGKHRPALANFHPLVDGLSFKLGSGSPLEGKSRVEMLKGAGNAIVPQVAARFILATGGMELFKGG